MGGASKLLMLLSTPFPLLYRRPSALRLARHSRVAPASLSTAACAAPLSSHSRLPSSGPCPRPGFSVRAAEQIHTQTGVREGLGDLTGPLSDQRASHPWTEWLKLVDHLTAAGYSGRRISAAAGEDDDSFLAYEDLPREFARDAESCLSFARDRPDLLRLLSKKDIEVIVENGSPFLFKNGVNSARRMRLFLSGGETDVLEYERAQTVDVIRYLLSYACNPPLTSDKNSIKATDITEASVRNLLTELVKVSGTIRESNFTESIPRHPPLRHEQLSRPPRQNIEMKRGDWICPKCSFMNFARNIRCLECKEGKPKRQLTGGEWECPQCDFFNYGRNMSCLRCDCKRPGETPPIAGAPGTSSGFSRNPSFEQILNGGNTDKTEIERRLAANDEKAERWFSKVSQMDDASDLSQAAADEDFPEIMPLRKGENRFVVSTRKTPLERRLANAQYRSNLGNDGAAEESDRTTESSVTQSLDRILGRTSGINPQSVVGETNAAAGSRFNFAERKQSTANQRRDPEYVPFVPLPADMFGKSKTSDNDMQRSTGKDDSSSAKASQVGDSDSKVSDSPTESKIDKESSDASERWSKKVAELSNTADLASTISDEDFPEIMPMRKGENRFVVSKKKDRSLTSPQYKRRLALEQANNSNFVPFVPFPPDYFAKKDKPPETSPPAAQPENSSSPDQVHGVTEKHPETKPMESKAGAVENMSRRSENWMDSGRSTDFSGRNSNASKMDSVYGAPTANPAPAPGNSWNNKDGWNSGASQRSSGAFSGASAAGASQPALQSPQNAGESWKFSGKSLEGSAVKEPDPLDMSEEAKAERWFRRVAQIKDISELSQIPDEDFPEIMPMRKGVNRFVVSKRKTPLERRLTSPQYRRNLPIVSSDPEKDASS